jgi:hypothetical protein
MRELTGLRPDTMEAGFTKDTGTGIEAALSTTTGGITTTAATQTEAMTVTITTEITVRAAVMTKIANFQSVSTNLPVGRRGQ